MNHKHEKLILLEQIKSLVETSLQLILSTKESAGNIKNLQWHKVVDNNSDALIKLIHTFEQHSLFIGIKNDLCDNIRKLISSLETTTITSQGHYMDYQSRMMEVLRQMIQTIQEINNSDNIQHLANQLTHEYHDLVNATYGAISTAAKNDLAVYIKNNIQELGSILIELIRKLADQNPKNDLDILCQKFIEKVIVLFSMKVFIFRVIFIRSPIPRIFYKEVYMVYKLVLLQQIQLVVL